MKNIKVISIYLFLITLLINTGCSKKLVINHVRSLENLHSMYGKTPQKDFSVPVNIGDTLRLKWKSKINGSFPATSVTAIDRYIFVPDLSGRIYAFNIDDGKELGRIRYKGIISTTPVINDYQLIFAVTGKNKSNSSIYFYDYSLGKEIASYDIEGKVQPEIIKTEDGIIYYTEDGWIGKISFTGGKSWEYKSKSFLHSLPAVYKNSIIFGSDKGDIFSINLKDGRLIFHTKTTNGFDGGFTISGDIVYTADRNGNILALNPNNGVLHWKQTSGTKINTVPVLDDSYIYVSNLKGEIFKLDKFNGKIKWKISTDGLINTTPLVFNDYLVQPDLNKKVFFINKQDGKINKVIHYDDRVKLSPVFFNNILFLGTDNGQVFAYEPVNN